MDYSREQVTHDEVNLLRLVRRLEKSVATEKDWDVAASTQQERVWLQALGTLQKVKHGRKLLRNLEQYDSEPSPKKARQRTDLKTTLDRIELFMTEVQKRTQPTPQRPEPILPRIPVPVEPSPDSKNRVSGDTERTEVPPAIVANEEPVRVREQVERGSNEALDEKSTLASPSPPPSSLLSPVSSLLPATPTPTTFPTSSSTIISPSSSSSATATATALNTTSNNNATLSSRKHLQASNALHEELSTQLAQMATQLKRNALHFSNSLAKDKIAVEEAQEKIEGNYTTMLTQRIRLRDFRGKSVGSTCLVVAIVVCVLLLFVVMVGVVRFSRR